MPYVVRFTFSPEHDLERGWSAWIGGAWSSREQALRALAEESPLYGRLLDEGRLDEEEIIEQVIEREEFDVRYNAAYGRWQHVHHDGLSCWPLEAETEAEAWEEARTGSFEWHGFGDSTQGEVRLIGQVRDRLYLFWCEDTVPEI